LGWLGKDELTRLYAGAYAGIACYARGATQSVTYKLFDYLAAGFPIVASLPGEMETIITKEDVGRHYEPENAAALAAVVKELAVARDTVTAMGRRGRAFAENRGDNARTYLKMVSFLESVSQRS
jgi:glycosyltransferase involved in cell wall biosynthesis